MNLQFDPNIETIIADHAEVTDGTLSGHGAWQTERTRPRNAEPTRSDSQMTEEIFLPPAAQPSDHCLVREIRARDQDSATQLLTTVEIAGRLNVGVKTVGTYRDRIREKLHLSDGRELAQYAKQWLLDHG